MTGGFFIDIDIGCSGKNAAACASRGTPCFEAGNVAAWSDEPLISLGSAGCVLGHVFSRDRASKRVTSFTPDERMAAVRSGGQLLLDRYWGGYILVLVRDDGAVEVLRSPSGLPPCYWRRANANILLSDSVVSLAAPGATSVDFAEVARLLSGIDAPGEATCLSGIRELTAGRSLTVAAGGIAMRTRWSPFDHIAVDTSRSFEESAAELRATLLECVGAWSACFGQVAIGLSGGLDSSLVAAAAAHTGARPLCVTMFGEDADGDERHHARSLALWAGLQLFEHRYDLGDIDPARPPAADHPWPNTDYFRQSIEAIHGRVQEAHSFEAIFTGNGGDGIFCSMRSALPLIDRYRAEGIGAGLIATLRDMCDLTGSTATEVLLTAVRRYRSDRGRHSVLHDYSGLTGPMVERLCKDSVIHPWRDAPDEALPGKTTHVAFLMRSHRAIELYPRAIGPIHVAPLLSQPIVELCLSLPTWQALRGGRNRAVAREAARHLLPEDIRLRTSKGGPGGFNYAIYLEHRHAIHRMLSNGLLVRSGVLDRSFLDAATDPTWRGVDRVQRIMGFAAAESWARWWSGEAAGLS